MKQEKLICFMFAAGVAHSDMIELQTIIYNEIYNALPCLAVCILSALIYIYYHHNLFYEDKGRGEVKVVQYHVFGIFNL